MFNTTKTNEYGFPYLSWTNDLLIGHEVIDADHQAIFDMANRLHAEIQEDPDYSIVGEILIELIEHTGDHFMREEALMEAIRLPGIEEHKQQHRMLMDKVNELHRRFMDGRSNVPNDVSEFLQKWLVPHIFHMDMELRKSMQASG